MSRRSQRLLPAPPVDASSPVPVGGSPHFQFRRFTLRRRLLTAVTRNGGSGASSVYGYDAFARLTSLAHDASGSGNDLTLGYGYNPAGQIVGRTVSDDDYVWTPATGGTAYTLNGLNQTTAVGGVSVTYDANQNATGITGHTYGYDAANRLTSATPSGGSAASFVFDPLSRLASSTVSSTTTRYQYAGVQLATEYDASGAVTRRYVPGLGLDGVVTAYTGSGVGTRDWLLADERGSVVALTGTTGAVSTINRYDEYGTPHTGNAGRFGYTGQAWMAEAAAWNYRARANLPGVGRFLQTDPIGYAAGMNLYAYVGADPVNLTDPMGLYPGEEISRAECFLRHGRVIPSPTGEGLDHCVPDISFGGAWDRMFDATPPWLSPGFFLGGGESGFAPQTKQVNCRIYNAAETVGDIGAFFEVMGLVQTVAGGSIILANGGVNPVADIIGAGFLKAGAWSEAAGFTLALGSEVAQWYAGDPFPLGIDLVIELSPLRLIPDSAFRQAAEMTGNAALMDLVNSARGGGPCG